jgi:serine protease Do
MIRTLFALLLAAACLAPPAQAQTRAVPESREAVKFSYAPIVKRVAPAVVNVYSRRVVRQQPPPLLEDPFFRRFFGENAPFGMSRERVLNSLGSGVIVDPAGLIVTNGHVITQAEEIRVVLSDRREFEAKVKLLDEHADLAVLSIDTHGEKLPALELGDSDGLEVGDIVLAIGNPFGVGQTVTTGIVSALARSIGASDFRSFIQTDAAINPGNSGGALVDVEGRLVGINTAILSRSGGFQGVGLAVPADLVGNVVDNLVAHGKVVRGYLGVGIQDLTPGLADSFGIKAQSGALITDVRPGTPGARAGLKSGDVVTAIDGQPVDSASRLSLSVGETAPGTKLTLDVLRDGKTEQVAVTTASKPSGDGRGDDGQSMSPGDDQGVLNGVGVGDIDSSARRDLNLPERLSGAVITGVDPASASARAGLREGDVILEINRHPVDSAKSAVDLSVSATGKKTLLKLWSHGNTVYVIVDETASAEAAP